MFDNFTQHMQLPNQMYLSLMISNNILLLNPRDNY